MAVPSPPLDPDKIALRRRAREARRAYVAGLRPDERESQERRLGEALAPLLQNARTIGAYAALPDEIDPQPAIAAGAPHALIGWPHFASAAEAFRFRAGEPIEMGPFGVYQPPASSPEIHPDLILVPLVAIDRRGQRLGHGKGHYDRVLPEAKRRGALAIGLGWPVQRLDEAIAAEPWDVPLDGFASPDGLEMFR